METRINQSCYIRYVLYNRISPFFAHIWLCRKWTSYLLFSIHHSLLNFNMSLIYIYRVHSRYCCSYSRFLFEKSDVCNGLKKIENRSLIKLNCLQFISVCKLRALLSPKNSCFVFRSYWNIKI